MSDILIGVAIIITVIGIWHEELAKIIRSFRK